MVEHCQKKEEGAAFGSQLIQEITLGSLTLRGMLMPEGAVSQYCSLCGVGASVGAEVLKGGGGSASKKAEVLWCVPGH